MRDPDHRLHTCGRLFLIFYFWTFVEHDCKHYDDTRQTEEHCDEIVQEEVARIFVNQYANRHDEEGVDLAKIGQLLVFVISVGVERGVEAKGDERDHEAHYKLNYAAWLEEHGNSNFLIENRALRLVF